MLHSLSYTTYSTLCWLLVPTVVPEVCSESATGNRKTAGYISALYSHKPNPIKQNRL